MATNQIGEPTPGNQEKIERTFWSSYNKAQTQEGKLFFVLLHDVLSTIQEPPRRSTGRPPIPLREALFVTIQKIFSNKSSRRCNSLNMQAVDNGHISKSRHFNTASKTLNRMDLIPILHNLVSATAAPLAHMEDHIAIDSSGFRTSSFNVYNESKYRGKTRRQHSWLKAHISVGVRTNIVFEIVITDKDGADCPQLAPLVMGTAELVLFREVSADKAYSSRDNLTLIHDMGATPYIPFKKNSKPKAFGSTMWNRMFHFFQMYREEFDQHYHLRSNVETTFWAIKQKLGETLRSRNQTAQVNELLCKFIAYNLTVLIQEMHQIGIQPSFMHRNYSMENLN